MGQRITPADIMEKAEGVVDVALATGVRTDDHGEWPEAQHPVGGALKRIEAINDLLSVYRAV